MTLNMPPDSATPEEVLAWAKDFGVDLSMLRERLRMTPTQRLLRHQQAFKMVDAMRNSKKVEHVSTGTAVKQFA
jgi:hypothetical protein